MNKKFITLVAMACLAVAVPLMQSGCSHPPVTLAPGGVYTDPILATTDQSILDADAALTGFVDWAGANAAYLAKYPEVTQAAANVAANKAGWIKNAYALRDAYAAASKAFKTAATGTGDPTAVSAAQAKLTGALAAIQSITAQVIAYQAAHPKS